MQTLNQTELILALILLIGAVTSFALEKIKIETTALCLLGLVLVLTLFGLENWPSFSEFLSILSSEAPLAIIAMFIVSSALSKQGVIERLTLSLQKLTFVGFSPFMLLLLTAVACLSAFINNTPVVVILLPVVPASNKRLVAGEDFCKLLLTAQFVIAPA